MYIPEHFRVPDEQDLHALIVNYPLGIIVTNGPNGMDAKHIPFELEGGQGPRATAIGHVLRALSGGKRLFTVTVPPGD